MLFSNHTNDIKSKEKPHFNGAVYLLVGAGRLARTALCAGCAQNVTIWLRYYLPNLLIFEPNNFVVWPTPQTTQSKTKTNRKGWFLFLVGAGGVEPPQSKTTDLQSAPALRLRRAPETYIHEFAVQTHGASRGNRTLISSLEGLHSSL